MTGKKEIRFAHSDGYTSVVFEESGKYILSSGSDGAVRVWNGYEDDSPGSHHLGSCISALAYNGDHFFVATENNEVSRFSFPGGEPQGTIARFAGNVYAISCSQDGKRVAMGGGDFIAKVVTLSDNSLKQFTGHQAPILSVAVDPRDEFLATSSCDGMVKIWSLSTMECLETWKVLSKSNDFCVDRIMGKISWQPSDGKCICVPVENGIQVYSRDGWHLQETLKDSYFEGAVSVSSFSPCGTYLAACDLKGKIVLWKFSSRCVLLRESHNEGEAICTLVWKPKAKEFIFSDSQGQFCMIEFEDSSEIKPASAQSTEDSESSKDVPKRKTKLRIIDDDDDDGVDISAIKAEYEPKIFGTEEETESAAAPPTVVPQQIPTNYQQSAFTPSSTPEHFQRRFMLWNNVGIVSSYDTEEENTIDVEFHDAALHHQMHLANNLNYTLAALSQEALLLASKLQGDKCSKLYCVNFGAWDSNREWSIDLPENEDAQAVTVGDGWVCCATDSRLLRLFSVGGVQLNLVSLEGPIVCLVAYEQLLVAVYHQSAGLTQDQHLVMKKFEVKKNKMKCQVEQALALAAKSTLVWFGFTDEGTVCLMDSKGVVRLADGNCWSPVLDTKAQSKASMDHHFLVGLSEIQQQIRYIPCKGSKYPSTLPRPVVAVMAFSLPFCEINTDKGKLEEVYCRSNNLHCLLSKLRKEGYEVDQEIASTQKKMIEGLMRLFALSTRSDREFRALEIGKLMPNARVVEGAIQYASHLQRMALAQRLGEVADDMMMNETEDAVAAEEIYVSGSKDQSNRFSLDKADDVIQPKPLSFVNRENPDENNDSLMDKEFSRSEEETTQESTSVVTNSSFSLQGKNNPFKVSSQQKNSGIGIDGILRDSIEQRKSKKPDETKTPFSESKSTDKKREEPKRKTPIGFQPYLEEKKEELSSEHPELDSMEISKMALQQFKKLTALEKKEWSDKGKTVNRGKVKASEKGDEEPTSNSKRAKKELARNTMAKISSFMFAKKGD